MRQQLCVLVVAAFVLSGCGSTKTFANRPKPASAVNLTVYINDARVSVSPGAVGSGQVTLIVTNQASSSQSVRVTRAAGGGALASTGPINPQGTATVDVILPGAGRYVVSTAASVRPATLQVGGARPSARNGLLLP